MARLENLLGAQALALSDRLDAAGREAVARSASECAALVSLLAHPDEPVSWLAGVLELTSSGITRLVDRLVDAGWVTRTAGVDARSRRLRLTRTGRNRANAVLHARRAAMADVLDELSETDREELERLLGLLVGRLAQKKLPALRVCRLCDRRECASAGRACPLEHTVDV
jgi:DNA-binding MarR family transcriptional regulator